MDCFGAYFTHAQSCDNAHVQSAFGHMLNFLVFAFACFRAVTGSVLPFSRFRVLPAASPLPGHAQMVY